MRAAVLGGAGMMGSGTVRDLLAAYSKDVEKVIVADVNDEKMDGLADDIKDPRLETIRMDVTEESKILEILKDADICINGVPTFAGYQMDIFNACYEARIPYVDYGGMGIYTVKQKADHDKWVKAGIPAVLGLGADPGMSNVMCKAVAEELDTIEKINLYWAAKILGPENPVLVPPYSVSTLLGEYANTSKQFINGRLVEMPPHSGKEILTLPEPFGCMEFMHTQHSEPLTVPFARGIKEKGIKEFTWKLHLPDAEHEVYKGLVKAGFGDFSSPVVIKGVEVTPLDFLNVLIKRNIERNQDRIPEQEGYELHLAIGSGKKNGLATTARCSVMTTPDPFYNDYFDAATSMNVSIGAQIICRSKINPGVWGPEEYFDTAGYFEELKKRHFRIMMKIETSREL